MFFINNKKSVCLLEDCIHGSSEGEVPALVGVHVEISVDAHVKLNSLNNSIN